MGLGEASEHGGSTLPRRGPVGGFVLIKGKKERSVSLTRDPAIWLRDTDPRGPHRSLRTHIHGFPDMSPDRGQPSCPGGRLQTRCPLCVLGMVTREQGHTGSTQRHESQKILPSGKRTQTPRLGDRILRWGLVEARGGCGLKHPAGWVSGVLQLPWVSPPPISASVLIVQDGGFGRDRPSRAESVM